MNKYQKQALIDMGKVAVAILAFIAVIQLIIMLGISGSTLIMVGSFVMMCYCIYQLYLIRVGQLESEDRRRSEP